MMKPSLKKQENQKEYLRLIKFTHFVRIKRHAKDKSL